MRSYHSMLAILAMSLAVQPTVTMAERASFDLPPPDPNLKIKKPAKSWGRKSKKRKG